MNESETRAELIDPKLKESGWGVVEGTRILREYHISPGKILPGTTKSKPEIADYILVINNQKVAVVEAKSADIPETEAVTQAKEYAQKLDIEFTYATNGLKIYEINMKTGKEWYLERFPTPAELLHALNADTNEWKKKFDDVPFEDIHGTKGARYYQEIAVQRTMGAIAENKQRILLTLATGTGKTFIAFQIAWKLFHARWNLQKDGQRRPRILFLADRNILANQAFNAFNAFPEDALVRIKPSDIRQKGYVPTNGSIFFTIFQSFMSGTENTPYYGGYPKDFFDFIIIDECHRGGANDESNWRAILDYFSPAVQLGLTATPKRRDNVDTYKYFGEPIYTYSLKEGINDGFLTPFKVKRIQTTLDDYIYTSDDEVVEGDVEEGKVYEEPDFNVTIEIREREEKRVKILLDEIDQNEKTIVFCANQGHAALIRDLINQNKKNPDPFYCVRVTANDGARGDQYLADFQDNEKTIPTILTTSQKLSTGVDARNVRNIALLRPVNSMIEFKQIIGRGTRLFDGKEFFTVYDYVKAANKFTDPEWDGEPLEVISDTIHEGKTKSITTITDPNPIDTDNPPKPKKIKIKLRDGKEREIQHMISVSFWSADGKPLSVEEFLNNLMSDSKTLFENNKDLREKWCVPETRKKLMNDLFEKGYGSEELESIQKIVSAGKCDMFDVIGYVVFGMPIVTREARVEKLKQRLQANSNQNERDFLEFVLEKYSESGEKELGEEKLPELIHLKYGTTTDAVEQLGGVEKIREMFIELQKNLYK